MRHPTFRQLEIFNSTARTMSFTQVAEELHLTQPTVSIQMKKLAEQIGLPLFERVGGQLYLTDTGQELVHTCKEVFSALDRFNMSVADLQGLKKGKLRISVVSTAKHFIPRLLGVFCLQYPDVEASLNISNREQALTRLADNIDDLYVLGQPPKKLNVVSVPFLENPLVAIASINHPLAKSQNISLSRFAKEPFLAREHGSGTRKAVQRLFDDNNVTLNVRMELGSNAAIKQAVIGRLGVSVMSRHALAKDPLTDDLAILHVRDFPIIRHWYIVHPSGSELSSIAKAFLKFLHQAVK